MAEERRQTQNFEATRALRHQLENLEQVQHDIPIGQSRPGTTTAYSSVMATRDTGRSSSLRRRSSSRRRSDDRGFGNGSSSSSSNNNHNNNSHVRFSGEASNNMRPPLRVRRELYTIQSTNEIPQVAARHDNRPQSPLDRRRFSDDDIELQKLPDTPSHQSRLTPEKSRFAGLGGRAKDMSMAAEASAHLAGYRDWVARQRERRRRLTRRPIAKVQAKVAHLYRKWIFQGLLRQFPIPPSQDGRHIPLTAGLAREKDGFKDERTNKSYISNFIRSSRYTIWSFLPKQLFFQFSKLANFYFLLISILQMIPGLSTTGTYTTIGPLMAFVAVSMAKEGYDDYRRYRMDRTENRATAYILDPAGRTESTGRRNTGNVEAEPDASNTVQDKTTGNNSWSHGEAVPWIKVQWQDVRVGDIIKLQRDQDVPADIALLHATGPNGVAYIETMALDGETNLKSKQACPLFADHCSTISSLRQCRATVVSEDPNLDLYNYEGKAVVNDKSLPLTLNQVVYRGSTLRNTSEAVGMVINTGEECKIRMNASKNVHAKAPAMQAIVNKIVILLVVFVVLLSVGCSMGHIMWNRRDERTAYYLNGAAVPFGHILVGFIIEFNTLIPLSLYVSLELIKLGQYLLMKDIDMYDATTDTPMVVNTTTILENLGQISYVFSDKTGTLTQNMMKFRKMSVAGVAWLHDVDLRRTAGNQMEATANAKGKTNQPFSPTLTVGSEDPMLQRRPTIATDVDHTLPNSMQMLEYIRRHPRTAFSKTARQFLLCIALCHTCLPETKPNGKVEFQAASPDELALVEAAQDLGYLLIDRPAQSIKLQFPDDNGTLMTDSFEVLEVIEFSSKRKRMSILVRMPNNQICIFTKGADSVILPRLRQSKLAMHTASTVERHASVRKSMEQEAAFRRMSVNTTSVASPEVASAATALSQSRGILRRASMSKNETVRRTSVAVDEWLTTREGEQNEALAAGAMLYSTPMTVRAGGSISSSLAGRMRHDSIDGYVDERAASDEQVVFERCFQQINDFATEGLRTLLYAYGNISEAEYIRWKEVYHAASTSLVDRQERIEAAAEQIEKNLDLAGATAIEDKLQQGVPDTIDKLRRANIKVWMLTGDKRETAINIAHSARICKPFSEIYILDATEGSLQDKVATLAIEIGRGLIPHSVIVIDGHTLSVVEEDDSLKYLFYDLVARVDSVICCRASPSQKATLVKCIRDRVPNALTLAIGDGANDIAMIQASHVGIGISGREGLQAARISDYSIAQFRFLQKLLFVHGRWNYIRTGKYILGTFWKEIVFYIVQACYQRQNGYTGTSLYESTSLAVFNTLFTSLAVILIGIFEQDLHAETLLAVPELYTFGQRNQGFNYKKYFAWMCLAIIEAIIIFYGILAVFQGASFSSDNTLYALGTMAFTVCIIFINVKMLLLEMHHKTFVPLVGFGVTVAGWFAWNAFLSSVFKRSSGPYAVRDGFTKNFGRQPKWWLTLVMVLATCVVWELCVAAVRKIYWPRDEDLMQEMERYEDVREVFRVHADGGAGGGGGGAGNGELDTGSKAGGVGAGAGAGIRGDGGYDETMMLGYPRNSTHKDPSSLNDDSFWQSHQRPTFRHPFEDSSNNNNNNNNNNKNNITDASQDGKKPSAIITVTDFSQNDNDDDDEYGPGPSSRGRSRGRGGGPGGTYNPENDPVESSSRRPSGPRQRKSVTAAD